MVKPEYTFDSHNMLAAMRVADDALQPCDQGLT